MRHAFREACETCAGPVQQVLLRAMKHFSSVCGSVAPAVAASCAGFSWGSGSGSGSAFSMCALGSATVQYASKFIHVNLFTFLPLLHKPCSQVPAIQSRSIASQLVGVCPLSRMDSNPNLPAWPVGIRASSAAKSGLICGQIDAPFASQGIALCVQPAKRCKPAARLQCPPCTTGGIERSHRAHLPRAGILQCAAPPGEPQTAQERKHA